MLASAPYLIAGFLDQPAESPTWTNDGPGELLNFAVTVGLSRGEGKATGGSAAQMAKGYPLTFYWEKGPAGKGWYSFWSVQHPGTKPSPFVDEAYREIGPQLKSDLQKVAVRVADDLRRLGRVDRGWLGVAGRRTVGGSPTPSGFRVEEVAVASPAATAGLRVGDVVIAVDDDRVRSLDDVRAALTLTRPGQTVTVEAVRGSETLTVDVVLAPSPGA